ncbi:GtrA family protein [Sphingomonas sp. VDB2]|uniref:GtrA family protein n=1 Tax=Sphingomonas sp. VDB2 TaxID=3228751 RepID=UPI003A80F67E|nr:GtrA family protein [Sphingobium sp.]
MSLDAEADGNSLLPVQSFSAGIMRRVFSLRAGAMLFRNTVVSCSVFVIGLGILWGLVNLGVGKVMAAGIGFIIANSLHYILGRSWIFRGTDRGVGAGYVLFLANSAVGLLITMGLYALFLHLTSVNYLVTRAVVSLFAGLVVFLLNALLNFRQV